MRQISASQLRELKTDLEIELNRLGQLEQGIAQVQAEIARDPERASIFYESLALKLHNFYTGCERIFQLIITELNGAIPSGYDWHKRLLNRMAIERQEIPTLLSQETVQRLQEFLGFRHVVRHIYGFELDTQRVKQLVETYPDVWHRFNQEVKQFMNELQQLADQLES
jgi:hypothetical protein